MIDSDTDWYVRLRISEALEGVAREIRAVGQTRGNWHEVTLCNQFANAIEEHASKMRGKLGKEADQEARDQEKQDEPFKTVRWS